MQNTTDATTSAEHRSSIRASRLGRVWLATGVLLVVSHFSAMSAGRTIMDGVYTVAQAERGKEKYGQKCSSCHGDFLEGGRGPALSGQEFEANWDPASL